jgi:hypothetical protein
LESLKRRDHLDDLGIDGRIILKWKHENYTNKIIPWKAN